MYICTPNSQASGDSGKIKKLPVMTCGRTCERNKTQKGILSSSGSSAIFMVTEANPLHYKICQELNVTHSDYAQSWTVILTATEFLMTMYDLRSEQASKQWVDQKS